MNNKVNNINPIFITGTYRTGSVFISRVLNNHPKLDITYDSINYFRFVLKKNISCQDYESIVNEVSSRMTLRYNININVDKILNNIASSKKILSHKLIYESIYNDFFEYSSNRWGEKSLMEWTNIVTFLSMYPEGRVIHMIRDPRDVMASYKFMTTETGKKYRDSIFCCMSSMNRAIQYKRDLSPTNYKVVLFEDLMMDRETVVRDICFFLNEDFYDEMLDLSNLIDKVHGELSSKTHTSFPEISDNFIDRWKNKLSDDEVLLIDSLLKEQMNYFSYEIKETIDKNKLDDLARNLFSSESLLIDRWDNYKETNDGVESYPSDPTNINNWVKRSHIAGKGAGKGYTKFKT